jgi:ferritin
MRYIQKRKYLIMEKFPLYREFAGNKPNRDLSETEMVGASPINPQALAPEIVSMLTQRLCDEYTAHFFYRNAANWCRNMNYKKAAAYFESEASSELDHAKGIQEYIVDFNVMPEIPQAPSDAKMTSLVDIINQAYSLELNLMRDYNENSSEVFSKDLTTFDFLQGYRTIQKEAVVEYSDLLNAVKLVDFNDKFQILYFEQTYF